MKVAEEGMVAKKKLLEGIMSGRSDGNVPFDSFRNLLKSMGFEEHQRRRGSSHYVYTKEGISELIDIQEEKGKAKVYQVR